MKKSKSPKDGWTPEVQEQQQERPEDAKDLCASCGCRTDSIMQGRQGMVCETCLESEDEGESDGRGYF